MTEGMGANRSPALDGTLFSNGLKSWKGTGVVSLPRQMVRDFVSLAPQSRLYGNAFSKQRFSRRPLLCDPWTRGGGRRLRS